MLESRTEGALKDEMAWPRGVWTSVLLSLLASGSLSCSAISATLDCRSAARTLSRLPSAPHDPAQIYQITRARAYLEKAREEAAEAHYGAARLLAQAAKVAGQAVEHTSQGRAE